MITPKTNKDFNQAISTLSDYKISFHTMFYGEDNTLIIVNDEFRNGDLRLCEMAFQMSFNQVGRVCPICKMEGETICGHLVFERSI